MDLTGGGVVIDLREGSVLDFNGGGHSSMSGRVLIDYSLTVCVTELQVQNAAQQLYISVLYYYIPKNRIQKG